MKDVMEIIGSVDFEPIKVLEFKVLGGILKKTESEPTKVVIGVKMKGKEGVNEDIVENAIKKFFKKTFFYVKTASISTLLSLMELIVKLYTVLVNEEVKRRINMWKSQLDMFFDENDKKRIEYETKVFYRKQLKKLLELYDKEMNLR